MGHGPADFFQYFLLFFLNKNVFSFFFLLFLFLFLFFLFLFLFFFLPILFLLLLSSLFSLFLLRREAPPKREAWGLALLALRLIQPCVMDLFSRATELRHAQIGTSPQLWGARATGESSQGQVKNKKNIENQSPKGNTT